MSGAVILPPPSEEPDERLDVVATQLRIARDSLSIADERVAKVKAWAADPLISWPDAMTLRILLAGRQVEATLWAREVELLERAAKTLGLVHP